MTAAVLGLAACSANPGSPNGTAPALPSPTPMLAEFSYVGDAWEASAKQRAAAFRTKEPGWTWSRDGLLLTELGGTDCYQVPISATVTADQAVSITLTGPAIVVPGPARQATPPKVCGAEDIVPVFFVFPDLNVSRDRPVTVTVLDTYPSRVPPVSSTAQYVVAPG